MRFLLFLAALLAAWAPAAAEAVAGPEPGAMGLFVELVVNGQPNGTLASLTQHGERLMLAAESLREAGIAIPGGGAVDVARLPDVHATYDAAGQRLLLDVPAAMLPTHRITSPTAGAMAPTVDTGGLFNYDLFVQTANGRTAASLWTEQRLFGRYGTLSNSGILAVGGTRNGYVRLDTRYQWTDERHALEFAAGDLITRALSWSTAVRIGGVQLSRNFALRPDLITVPLPSFSGEAAVPTGVDLFINGYRQSRTDVAPGRFVLDSVPVVNGAGEARIVTTDAVGRQIATVIPFYVAPELLRKGLSDFSVEAGALRHGYGRASFDYGRAIVSVSARHGLLPRLTVSGHAESARGMAAAGAGAVWGLGLFGAVNGAVLVSRTGSATGRQLSLGYNYTSRRLSVGAEHVERSSGFTDLGGFDLGRFAGSRRSDRISLSLPIGPGSVGAGYIAARLRDGGRTRLASASASMALGARASLFGAADYDLDRRSISAQLRLVVPFGRNTVSSAGFARQTSGGLRAQAGVARTVPTSGGLGYALDAAYGTRGNFIGQASAALRTGRAQIEGGVATSGDARSAWGSVSGSIAVLEGHVFAANALPGAFALVSTGMPRVPVYYENQKMGVTGRDGSLFVPNVAAAHASRFAIDPIDLPIGAIADRTDMRAVLRSGTGAIIRLPVAFHHSVTARIVDAAGQPLAPGAIATLSGATPSEAKTTIGWDGVIVIERMTGRVAITVDQGAKTCRAGATIAAALPVMADIGTITCR